MATNEMRVDRAAQVLRAYALLVGQPLETRKEIRTAISDLIGDLLHAANWYSVEGAVKDPSDEAIERDIHDAGTLLAAVLDDYLCERAEPGTEYPPMVPRKIDVVHVLQTIEEQLYAVLAGRMG